MNDDMILDMDTFDFTQIDGGVEVEEVEDFEEDFDLADDDSDEDIPDWMKPDEGGEEEEDGDVDVAMQDFDSSFNLLPDDYEIAFGDTKVSKKDLASVVAARDEITKTKEALTSFVSGIVSKEDVIKTTLTIAKTETELQLDRVNEILDNPDDYTGDLKQVISAKRTLTARMKELDAKGQEAHAALEAQREQAAALAIQNTAKQVTGGMEAIKDAYSFAQSRGISADIFMKHISPELIAMVQDAKRYTVAMEKNKARATGTAKAKAPTSTASAKKASAAKAAANKKAALLNRLRAGKHVDPSDAFMLIED
ncbi:MAG: hypothetical protein ACRDCE_22885 [Cetobacterium sp.]|uniref:hypothetical protein n=1 Tax=Cetobacterium sp. TaxID=2071632 RepID=UPI003EE5DDD0